MKSAGRKSRWKTIPRSGGAAKGHKISNRAGTKPRPHYFMGRCGVYQPNESEEQKPAGMSRLEERLRIAREERPYGVIRARKEVVTEPVTGSIPRYVEDAEVERISPREEDSGQVETLPDGSISIPILEEELVITKRVVVRERLIIRKRTRTEQVSIEADLKRERVSIEADPEVELHPDQSV